MRGALRACHGLDIAFAFGTLDAPLQPGFPGTGPDAEAVSAAMMDTWLAFARSGHPSHPRVGDWPRYDSARRATMVFAAPTVLQDSPFDAERATWDDIL